MTNEILLMVNGSKDKKGFTLIEAMLAVMVLAIAAGGVLLPFSQAATVHIEGARYTLASKLASDLMEEIAASDYDQIVAAWDGYAESEGQITKARSAEVYTGQAYKFFSRTAECRKVTHYASETDRLDTELGIWVTVTVSFNGKEMSKINTLVSK